MTDKTDESDRARPINFNCNLSIRPRARTDPIPCRLVHLFPFPARTPEACLSQFDPIFFLPLTLSHLKSSSFYPFHSLSFPLPAALAPALGLFSFLVAFPDVRHVYPNLLLLRYPHTPQRDSLATPSLSVSRVQPHPSLDSTTCVALRSVIQDQTQTRLLQRPHASVELSRSKIRPL